MEVKKIRKKEQLIAFGKHLRALRIERGLSGVGFAEKLGVDKQFLSRLELGQSDPRITTLIRLAQALNMDVADLLEGMEYPPALED
jgi:transcriptional regulator with XRE-family HTH domain